MNFIHLAAIQILICVALGFFDESPYIFDLTTEEGINNAETTGFNLSKPPYRAFFKVENSVEARN